MKAADFFLALVALPGRLKNRLLNVVFSKLRGVEVRIAWSDAKIIGSSRIEFGNRFFAGRGLWLETLGEGSKLVIGDNVNVSDWVHIAAISDVSIGNGVLIGSKVIITDHNHGRYSGAVEHSSPHEPPNHRLLTGAPVRVGDRAFLGDNVVVLPGSVIGEGAIIGANSTVSGHIPPDTMAFGNPARPVRRYDPATRRWVPLRPT